ncbi:MAG: alpha/beta hydrolase [Thermodesulfobacteriota bacterium]|nr:alpha/beta hydrolase [Thermodesulfobacteriota bacterium]
MPFLEIDNIKINYATGKDGIIAGRKNLLFIHGGGGNCNAWLLTLRFSRGDHNLIAIELPGHGRSGGEGEKDIESYSEWIKRIIEHMSLEKCFLIGHSMGGAITLSFVLKYPQYLDGIVLVGTGARLRISHDIMKHIEGKFHDAVTLICRLAYSDNIPQYIIRMGEREMLKTKPEVLFGDVSACNAFDLLHDLSVIRTPTLIICGKEDRLTPTKYSCLLHENIKGSRLVIINDGGHMVMIERPKEFNKLIHDFVSNHSQSEE